MALTMSELRFALPRRRRRGLGDVDPGDAQARAMLAFAATAGAARSGGTTVSEAPVPRTSVQEVYTRPDGSQYGSRYDGTTFDTRSGTSLVPAPASVSSGSKYDVDDDSTEDPAQAQQRQQAAAIMTAIATRGAPSSPGPTVSLPGGGSAQVVTPPPSSGPGLLDTIVQQMQAARAQGAASAPAVVVQQPAYKFGTFVSAAQKAIAPGFDPASMLGPVGPPQKPLMDRLAPYLPYVGVAGAVFLTAAAVRRWSS